MVVLIAIATYVLMTVIILFAFFSIRNKKKQPKDRMNDYFTQTQNVVESEQVKDNRSNKRIRNAFQSIGSKGILKRSASKSELRLLQADIKVTPEEFAVIQMILYLISFIVFFSFMNNILMGLLSIPITFILIKLYFNIKISRRSKAFNNQLGDALGILANSLRSGYSYLQAMSTVAREMPEPISVEFSKVVKEMSLGMSDEKSLNNLMNRIDSEDLSLMVTAILIQKETGGNLAEILDNISDTIKDRIKLKGEVKTLTAQGRLSAGIVVALPFGLGIFMYFSNPGYIVPFLQSVIGKVAIGYGLLSIMLGVFFISKIIKIEV